MVCFENMYKLHLLQSSSPFDQSSQERNTETGASKYRNNPLRANIENDKRVSLGSEKDRAGVVSSRGNHDIPGIPRP